MGKLFIKSLNQRFHYFRYSRKSLSSKKLFSKGTQDSKREAPNSNTTKAMLESSVENQLEMKDNLSNPDSQPAEHVDADPMMQLQALLESLKTTQ